MATIPEVGRTEVTQPSDREVRATRVFDAPRELVWEAFTKPEHVSRWCLGPPGWTMPVCEIDLRVGGEWHWVWRKEDGTEFGMRGEYREIVPPERLVNTESWGEDWPVTVNTLVLTDEGGRTLLTQTLRYPTKEDRDRALGTGMTDGWTHTFDRLDAHLAAQS